MHNRSLDYQGSTIYIQANGVVKQAFFDQISMDQVKAGDRVWQDKVMIERYKILDGGGRRTSINITPER